MTEAQWSTCEDIQALLRFTTDETLLHPLGWQSASQRKLRLFACALCRLVWNRLEDERSRHAVEVAEAFADGVALPIELRHADDAASDTDGFAIDDPASSMAGWVAYWRLLDNVTIIGRVGSGAVEMVCAWALDGNHPLIPARRQCAVLRNIFGNPWRKKPDLRPVLRWNDRVVPKIAGVIYSERQWDLMPQLGDALEEAGCTDETMLHHCRGEELCTFCMLPTPQEAEYGGGNYWCPGCGGSSENGEGTEGWMTLRAPFCLGDWVIDELLVRK